MVHGAFQSYLIHLRIHQQGVSWSNPERPVEVRFEVGNNLKSMGVISVNGKIIIPLQSLKKSHTHFFPLDYRFSKRGHDGCASCILSQSGLYLEKYLHQS